MCDPVTLTVVAAGAMVAGGGYTAYNQYQEGAAAKKYYDYQADQTQQEAAAVLRQGEQQSNLIQDTAKVQGKELKTQQGEFNSSNRVLAAAMGMSGGSLEDATSNNLSKQQMDEALLRYNADVKSWESKETAKNKNWALGVQADQLRYAGKNAKSAGKRQAIGTLLGTAASVAMLGAGGLGGSAKTGVKTPGGFSGMHRVPSLSF